MIWPYIVTAVAILLLIILFSNAKIAVIYDDKLYVSVQYLFIKIAVLGKDKKDKKKSKSDNKEDKSVQKKQEDSADVPVLDKIYYAFDMVRVVLDCASFLFRRLKIDPLVLRVSVHSDDAALTAIECGAVNAAAYNFAGWLSSLCKVRKTDFSIVPDYDDKSKLYFKTVIKLTLITAIITAVKFYSKYKKVKKPQAEKEGAKNE